MPRPTLFNNPKFRVACRRLNIPEAYLLGHLEFLWASANECGNPSFSCHEAVEAAARWVGEDGGLTEVISKPGSNFIDLDESGGYTIHDYWDHAPDYVRKRKSREDDRKVKSLGNSSTDRSVADNGEQRQNSAENGTPHSHSPTPTPTPALKEDPSPGPADAGHGGEGASESKPSPSKPESWKTKPDPLAAYPRLLEAYPKIEKKIIELHPHAKLPAPGTKQYFDSRQTLARLVSIDKHTESDVLSTLSWVVAKQQPGRDGFLWRDHFQSINGLRNITDGMTKFAKMLEAMQRHQKQAERVRIDPDEPIHHREAREKGLMR